MLISLPFQTGSEYVSINCIKYSRVLCGDRKWGFQYRKFGYETEGRWDDSRTWDEHGASLPHQRTTASPLSSGYGRKRRNCITTGQSHTGFPDWGVLTSNQPQLLGLTQSAKLSRQALKSHKCHTIKASTVTPGHPGPLFGLSCSGRASSPSSWLSGTAISHILGQIFNRSWLKTCQDCSGEV